MLLQTIISHKTLCLVLTCLLIYNLLLRNAFWAPLHGKMPSQTQHNPLYSSLNQLFLDFPDSINNIIIFTHTEDYNLSHMTYYFSITIYNLLKVLKIILKYLSHCIFNISTANLLFQALNTSHTDPFNS